jgi:hypothetical protein
MSRFVFALLAASVAHAADDAAGLLAKARAAYIENRERERFWNWTTTTNRSVVQRGRLVDELPSVTVESPIRSDGRRCNAVLAWGDGREPYLATADADSRCTVEKEVADPFKLEALLSASTRVRIQSRSKNGIVLSIRSDKALATSFDPHERCIASVRSTLRLDPVSFFPSRIEVEAVDHGCEQQVAVVNHYDQFPVNAAMTLFRKGTVLEIDYELQKTKSGSAAKDFWIAARKHSIRPMRDASRVIIIWGRRFELDSFGKDRSMVVDESTSASELSTDTTVRFETEMKKDK